MALFCMRDAWLIVVSCILLSGQVDDHDKIRRCTIKAKYLNKYLFNCSVP